jgi:hypothetical protein
MLLICPAFLRVRQVPVKWIRHAFNLLSRVLIRNIEAEIDHKTDLFQLLNEEARAEAIEAVKKKKGPKKSK